MQYPYKGMKNVMNTSYRHTSNTSYQSKSFVIPTALCILVITLFNNGRGCMAHSLHS